MTETITMPRDEYEADTLLLKNANKEVARLREVVVRYGDRARMSFAPLELQASIDMAFHHCKVSQDD